MYEPLFEDAVNVTETGFGYHILQEVAIKNIINPTRNKRHGFTCSKRPFSLYSHLNSI